VERSVEQRRAVEWIVVEWAVVEVSLGWRFRGYGNGVVIERVLSRERAQ